jgi:hypothetical protein
LFVDCVGSEAAAVYNLEPFNVHIGPGSGFTSQNHKALKGMGLNYGLLLFDANIEGHFNSSDLIPNVNVFDKTRRVNRPNCEI